MHPESLSGKQAATTRCGASEQFDARLGVSRRWRLLVLEDDDLRVFEVVRDRLIEVLLDREREGLFLRIRFAIDNERRVDHHKAGRRSLFIDKHAKQA